METTFKTQVKVGIFIFLGLLAFLISIYLLGGDRAILKSYYTLHARFDQVQGLAPGSVVSLSGVTVGNVSEINFLNSGRTLNVQMKIDTSYKDKITEGSQVEVRTQGALGDKYIYIIPGKIDAPIMAENGILNKAEATDFIGVLTENGDQATKIFEIIDEMHKTMKSLNHENRMSRLIGNLTLASESASKSMDLTYDLLKEIKGSQKQDNKIRTSLDKLDRILSKIDRGEGTLGALINDPSVHQQLKSMLGGSSRTQPMKSLLRSSIKSN